MKINFPNRYTVYLHDTNHRDYFSLSYRSLSSGCVRLQKPLEMAEHILNDSILWPLQKIKDTTDISHYKKIREMKLAQLNVQQAKLKKKYPNRVFAPIDLPKAELKTILIRVKEDISIHQWYWTAWEEKGVLQFREDIYCLDASLYTLLRYK
jgi:murein L,D-transpeptidase YcbB/YkuD